MIIAEAWEDWMDDSKRFKEFLNRRNKNEKRMPVFKVVCDNRLFIF